MPISEDSRAALALLKEVQQSVRDTEDLKNNAQVIFKQLDNSGLKCNCFWVLLSLKFVIVGVSVRPTIVMKFSKHLRESYCRIFLHVGARSL
jgi:hypothetical protein